MRVIKTYHFDIKTKIPFSEWPTIVHSFFEECGVHYGRYMYYFEDLLTSLNPDSYLPERYGCGKIVKDLPALGEVQFQGYAKYRYFDFFWLSNIDGRSEVSEADILPLMKKIHRRYGFTGCSLYYYDINFFERIIPFERDYSDAITRCQMMGVDYDSTVMLDCQPYGSGIVLHRDITGYNYLNLSIDVLHDGKIFDAEPYVEKMRALLPNIRYTESMKIYLSDEEKQQVKQTNRIAGPVIKKACDYLNCHLQEKSMQNLFVSNYSVAPELKKLTKAYGYQYEKGNDNYYFWAEKRTEKGNILTLVVTTGPSHYDLSFKVKFQGLGFTHRLCRNMQTPTNQPEANACLADMFTVMQNFEADILPELDACFPPTPNWFIPRE